MHTTSSQSLSDSSLISDLTFQKGTEKLASGRSFRSSIAWAAEKVGSLTWSKSTNSGSFRFLLWFLVNLEESLAFLLLTKLILILLCSPFFTYSENWNDTWPVLNTRKCEYSYQIVPSRRVKFHICKQFKQTLSSFQSFQKM